MITEAANQAFIVIIFMPRPLTLRSDWVPFTGDSLERSYFFLRPTVHTVFSNAPTFRGQSRLSGFGCVLDHCATTFGACAHLMKTAVRYQLRAQGRSLLSGPNMFGGTTGRSPSERPHYGIAGESPT